MRVIKSDGMGQVEHVSSTEEIRNTYRILLRRSESLGPLGRHRHKWKDTTKGTLILSFLQQTMCKLNQSSKPTIILSQSRDRFCVIHLFGHFCQNTSSAAYRCLQGKDSSLTLCICAHLRVVRQSTVEFCATAFFSKHP